MNDILNYPFYEVPWPNLDGSPIIVWPELDDHVILAVGTDNAELLRFTMFWGEHKVLIKYPSNGPWDSFCSRVSTVLRKLGGSLDHVTLPDSIKQVLTKDDIQPWTEVAAAFLRDKMVGNEITDIFITYLQPIIQGYDGDVREFINTYAPIDITAKLFMGLLVPERMLKKKIQYGLSQIGQPLTIFPSATTSVRNGISLKQILQESPFSVFD